MLSRCIRTCFAPVLLGVMVMQVWAEEGPVSGEPVARAAFTTRVVNREPVDRVLVLNPPATEAYFFTDLRNMQGHTVTHRWKYQGKTVSNVPFVVGGDRWRVFSRKVFPADSYGEWSVTVFDDNGWPLYVELFRYEPADTDIAHRQAGFLKEADRQDKATAAVGLASE